MNENDRQNKEAMKKNIIRLAFKEKIEKLEKTLAREMIKAKKLSQKEQEQDIHVSRARKTTLKAKIDTAWEEIRRIEFYIRSLEEETKKYL